MIMRQHTIKGLISVLFVLLITQSASTSEIVGRRERYTIYSSGSSYWMEQDGRRVARFHAGTRDADPRRISFKDLIEGNIDIPNIIMSWFVDMVYNDIKKSLNNNGGSRASPAPDNPRNPRDRDNPHGGAIPSPTRR
jgi:hypothetical protein